jgi:hypothetical protein
VGDHWHARYTYAVCDEVRPNAPFWQGGVNTEADGIIHIHPFNGNEEGSGARLEKWFEYGGGELAEDSVRLPGDTATYRNGEACSDDWSGVVQVRVNGMTLDEWERYIPQDGDEIFVYFGPESPEYGGPFH